MSDEFLLSDWPGSMPPALHVDDPQAWLHETAQLDTSEPKLRITAQKLTQSIQTISRSVPPSIALRCVSSTSPIAIMSRPAWESRGCPGDRHGPLPPRGASIVASASASVPSARAHGTSACRRAAAKSWRS